MLTFPNMEPIGREGRRQRRERARQVAKEILASQNRLPYKTEIAVAIASVAIPLGWGELMSGHEPWRITLGWILWSVPLFLFGHIFWRWSRHNKWHKALPIAIIVLFTAGFVGLASRSIWQSLLPNFVFIKPGLNLDPLNPQSSFWSFVVVVRGRESLYNNRLSFWDLVKGEEVENIIKNDKSLSHEDFHNLTLSNLLQRDYPELDASPSGGDNELGMFYWHPPVINDERYKIILVHRTGSVSEDLVIKKEAERNG